jgi:hypothetical protein
LAAIGRAITAVELVAQDSPEPVAGFLDERSYSRDVDTERTAAIRMTILWYGGSSLSLGLFSGLLFNFARRLYQCAAGRITLDRILASQNACWIMGLVVVVVYVASVVWVW